MKFLSQTFMIRTDKGPQFIDITERVEDAARESGVSNGFAVVFSRHTTAAIRINENEPALLGDMEKMLEQIAPSCAEYRHNESAHAFSTNGERPNVLRRVQAQRVRARLLHQRRTPQRPLSLSTPASRRQ